MYLKDPIFYLISFPQMENTIERSHERFHDSVAIIFIN